MLKIKIKAENQPAWLVYSVNTGDKEYDLRGKVISEVENVDIAKSDRVDSSNNILILTANILGSVTGNNKEVRFKNKLIKVGSFIELYLSNTKINGTVVELNPQKNNYQEKVVSLVIYDQFPWLGDGLKTALKSDANKGGEKILEVKIEQALKSYADNNGVLQETRDPTKIDIYLKILLRAKEENNELTYNETQLLLVGYKLALKMQGMGFLGMITKVEDPQ